MRKLDQGHEGKGGILMEKFYLGSQMVFHSFIRFVLLLSWLPMFENVKVITQKGENYILALVSKQI